VRAEAGEPLRVTLAWGDPPASVGSAVALVNNLDLEVVAPDNSVYFGNVLSGSGATTTSITGGTADARNNVEQIVLPTPATGDYTIRVKGTAVPGTGLNGSDKQGYAVVSSQKACASAVTAAPASVTPSNAAGAVTVSSATTTGATGYQVYRAPGTCAANSTTSNFQFVASGSAAAVVDTNTQGGFTYAYRTRAVDACGEGPLSNCAELTSTAACTLLPNFNQAAVVAARPAGNGCGVVLTWAAGTSGCPASSTVRYNVYRGNTPFFTPDASNRIATAVTGTTYTDVNVAPLQTKYYIVRAEDNTTGNGGPSGGNETRGNALVKFTPSLSTSVAGTFRDNADIVSFMNLGTPWAVSNRQAASVFSYRNANNADATYLANTCAAITTPTISIANGAQMTFKARWNLENEWDGVVIEASTNGGTSWSIVNQAGLYNGTLAQTGTPPINQCGYAASQAAFTGASGGFVTRTVDLAALAGQGNVQLRFRFTSDPGSEEEGFYLDDLEITNATTPQACTDQRSNVIFANGMQ
jgi:hypothetical protein